MTQQPDGWWFTFDDEHYGPYDTKREAEEALRGLRKFAKHKDEKDFITTDTKRTS